MDEVFWSNVVKRWSEATENVIRLKKELAKVQEERTIFRDALHGVRRSGITPRSISQTRLHGHAREESARTIVVDDDQASSSLKDELHDAEVGLDRAKEEYRRLQRELVDSADAVKALKLENERLTASHQQEIDELRNERQQIVSIQKELHETRSENRSLFEKVRDLEHELANLSNTPSTTGEVTPRPPFLQPSFSSVGSLEKQVETLKQSVEVRDVDNEDLRQELVLLQEKLEKAEENNRILSKSLARLQDIARHSMTGALHAISNNLPSGPARTAKRVSIASSNRSKGLDSENSKGNASLSSTPDVSGHAEDITVVDSTIQSSYGFLPSKREVSLSKLPVVYIKDIGSDNSFDRDFLKNALGEGSSSLIKRLGSGEEKETISPYLCPTLNHHPWCPSAPGQHGFIFVGLGKEKESYKSTAVRNLFVGLTKTQPRTRKFRYLGTYKVSRVRSLNVDEWNALSEDAKLMYAKLTKEKTKDSRPTEEILADYDHGDLLVPCVLLQCISFDERLYEALISHRDTEPRL